MPSNPQMPFSISFQISQPFSMPTFSTTMAHILRRLSLRLSSTLVVINESHHTAFHAQLVPMDVDHTPHSKDAPYSHSPSTGDTQPPCLTSDPHPCNLEGI